MEALIYIRDYETEKGYSRGDIVELRDDGYWTVDHDFNHNAFIVVAVPGVSVPTSYILPLFEPDPIKGGEAIVKKRMYKLKTLSTSQDVYVFNIKQQQLDNYIERKVL